MDKKIKYQNVIKNLASEVAALMPTEENNFQTFKIFDDESSQYLIYTSGWVDGHRDYGCFFHMHITENDKVYIEHDGTDLVLADQLVEQGVEQSDIVLAWHAPDVRHFVKGFALA
ncbi:MAG: element excision factor XisI family protein [Bacteroidota bacterium]